MKYTISTILVYENASIAQDLVNRNINSIMFINRGTNNARLNSDIIPPNSYLSFGGFPNESIVCNFDIQFDGNSGFVIVYFKEYV